MFVIKKVRTYRYEIILAVLVACMGIFSISNLGTGGFWTDDLFTCGAVKNGTTLADLIRLFLTSEVTNPPFYDLVEYFWYRIAPHTEFWQLIPNYIFYVLAGIILCRIVWKLTEKKYAVVCMTALLAGSTYAAQYMYNVLRSYALMFFLMSLVLSFWISVNEESSWRNIIILGIAMMLLSFTHYFGPIALAGLGVVDASRYVYCHFFAPKGEEIPFRRIVSYLMVLLTLGPWLILAMTFRTRSVSEFWPGRPTVLSLIQLVVGLIGTKYVTALLIIPFLFYLFCIGGVIINNTRKMDKDHFFALCCLCDVSFVIGVVFIYSRWINPKGSIFVNHYFIVVMPQIMLFCILSLSFFIHFLEKGNTNNFFKKHAALLITLCFVFVASIDGSMHMKNVFARVPFQRYASEYVVSSIKKENGKKVAIYTPDYIREGEATAAATRVARIGYRDFYLSGVNFEKCGYLDDQSDFSGYDRIYVCNCVFYDANIYIAAEYADDLLKNAGYIMTEDYTDAYVRVYDRK